MISVREALNIVGQTTSIKELAHQRNASFPLSLREFVGALPAGRLRTRVIPLELLQQKFDLFFNERERPLFKIRFHNVGSGDHRHSTVDVFFDDPVKGYISQLEEGQPRDLGQLEIDLPLAPNPDFHFSELESRALTANIISDQAVGIEVVVDFETGGEGFEMIANNFPDVDLTGLRIKLRFNIEHDSENGRVDLRIDSTLINTDASVDVSNGVPDGIFASGVEGKFNSKIAEGLKEYRDAINEVVTRLVVSGDFYVTGVSSDGQKLIIDYILPLGQLEPFPENPQAPLDPGLLKNIDHIVVVMMENRSFDHMLGYLSKEGHKDGTKRPDVDGLRGGEKNRYKGRDFQSFPLTETVFLVSPCHEHDCVTNQISGGKMEGFVADFANRYEADGIDPGSIMGYHTSNTVPVYDALTREFLISDRWFSAHPGPTFPNRFYTLTGRLNRDANERFEFDNPHGDAFAPVFTRSLFDHLNERGISWRYYEHGYCFLRMFELYTFDNQNILDAGPDSIKFVNSALNGTLPSVTFIDPDFIDVPPGFDDGPPADVAAGQHFLGTVVDALIRGPLWSKTLLIITYDEHGGFYDHVAPPKTVPVSAIDDLGVRVPTFIISPWVDRGKATSSTHPNLVFDHTSIAKTIIRRFMSANPPDMGERVAQANDLSMVLRSTSRADKPTIPVPAAPVVQAALALRAVQDMEDDEQDFKGVLRAIHARYPTPV
jgi:phospholipase C